MLREGAGAFLGLFLNLLRRENKVKELLVTIGLLILGVIIASLILSDGGVMGAVKDLFINQVQLLAD